MEDYETISDLEIESCIVRRIDCSFIPLEITRDNLLISTNLMLQVTGYAEVIDEENSIWDSIDQEYVYSSYMDIDFTDVEVEVECEVLISFDIDDPADTAQVISFKLLNQGNICIKCEDAIVTQIEEDEMAIRVLREDMGYSRRRK